ncbi:MAG: tyrosine-type recombinase/integrase [Armatimonadetes bacterium]|nr:tyrosine-type recombinase/integrase [Armatimonadota bacterium]
MTVHLIESSVDVQACRPREASPPPTHPSAPAAPRCVLSDDDPIALFAEHCRDYLRHRPATVAAYASDCRATAAWLRQQRGTSLEGASVEDLVAHIRAQAHLADATIARRIRALHAFYKFAELEGVRTDLPTKGLRAPKVRRQEAPFVTDKDLQALLNACRTSAERALLLALALAGLRRSEVLKLDLSDVDLDARRLRIRDAKGGKDRIVPMVPELVEALRTHLLSRPDAASPAVFVNSAGNRLQQTGLQRTFTRWVRDAGLQGCGYTLHALRHGAATRWLRDGLNIREIQLLLGHEDIATTAGYLHTDLEDVARSLDATQTRVEAPAALAGDLPQTSKQDSRSWGSWPSSAFGRQTSLQSRRVVGTMADHPAPAGLTANSLRAGQSTRRGGSDSREAVCPRLYCGCRREPGHRAPLPRPPPRVDQHLDECTPCHRLQSARSDAPLSAQIIQKGTGGRSSGRPYPQYARHTSIPVSGVRWSRRNRPLVHLDPRTNEGEVISLI